MDLDFLWAKMENRLDVVVKEQREMEIGYPTDVKHVAHIGLDGPSGSAPSWVRSPHITAPFLFLSDYPFIGKSLWIWSTNLGQRVGLCR